MNLKAPESKIWGEHNTKSKEFSGDEPLYMPWSTPEVADVNWTIF